MALPKVFNNVGMTVASAPGTGDISLGSAISDAALGYYDSFSGAGAANGNAARVRIEDGSAWSIEEVTYSTTGPILTGRTNKKSSTGSLLSLSSAAKVYGIADAEYLGAMLANNQENQPLSGGATVTPKDLGTLSTGTLTVDAGDCPWQKVVHGAGGFALDVATNIASCYVTLTNSSASGSITTSAFDDVDGDAFDNTSGSEFLCHMGYTPGGSKFLSVRKIK